MRKKRTHPKQADLLKPQAPAPARPKIDMYATDGDPRLKGRHRNFIRGWNQVKFRRELQAARNV